MGKLVAVLAIVVSAVSHWIPSAIVASAVDWYLDPGFFLGFLVFIGVYTVWHWGGFFLAMGLMGLSLQSDYEQEATFDGGDADVEWAEDDDERPAAV